MAHLVTYPFKPLADSRQKIHVISVADRIQKGGNTVLLPHRTNFFIVQLALSGNAIHMVDFHDILLNSGDVLIISPGQVHCFKKNDLYEGLLIAFPKDFFYQSARNIHFIEHAYIFNNLNPYTKLHFSDDVRHDITVLAEKIQTELSKTFDEYQQAILYNYLSNLLLICERSSTQNDIIQPNKLSPDAIYITKFKRMVQEKFKDHLKVKDYAAALFIGERKLQKITETLLGKSPKELINEQLILEAKRMLIHESMSVKEVSYFLGFDEPSNFTKFFRTQTGISPSGFKDSYTR